MGIACWGNNASHQLNSLDAGPSSVNPVISLSSVPSFSEIAAGDNHACALDGTGHVICWGDNSSGQLGPAGPTIVAGASAVSVAISFGTLGSPSHIAAGGNTTCATFASVVACWGANEHGQLGHAPSLDSNQACPGNEGACNPDPTVGTVAIAATALAVGPTAVCALKADGTVWCWGSAAFVGNGAAAPDAATLQIAPVQVIGLPPP